jgi:hypothetical protein
MNKLLLIAGGGALLYWWYSKQEPATGPATTPPLSRRLQPGNVPTPQPGNVTVTPTPDQQDPVTKNWYRYDPVTKTWHAITSPADLIVPTTPKTSALDAAYLAIQTQARQDPSLLDASGNPNATFSQWNWYLMTYGGQADLPAYYDATGGQTDPNLPMNAQQYWTIMMPWLKANRGLSGFGAYAPAYRTAFRRSPYLGPGGWLA